MRSISISRIYAIYTHLLIDGGGGHTARPLASLYRDISPYILVIEIRTGSISISRIYAIYMRHIRMFSSTEVEATPLGRLHLYIAYISADARHLWGVRCHCGRRGIYQRKAGPSTSPVAPPVRGSAGRHSGTRHFEVNDTSNPRVVGCGMPTDLGHTQLHHCRLRYWDRTTGREKRARRLSRRVCARERGHHMLPLI